MDAKNRMRGLAAPLGALLVLSLAVPALAAAAPAATVPNPNAAPLQWAYGAIHYQNRSASTAAGEYTSAAVFGWTVVYTLTNTSNSSFTLEAQRTVGLRYTANLCVPSCANPRVTWALSIEGIEREIGFSNYTTLASVYENGSASPALGEMNAHTQGGAYLNESLTSNRTVAGTTESFAESLKVGAAADSNVSFAPALGVIPWNLAPGLTWNASAPFTATGMAKVGFAWTVTGNNGTGPVSLNGTGGRAGAVNASGTAGLMGADFGNITLRNGASVTVIALSWDAGPFDGLDGVILVPRAFEIFGGAASLWAGHGLAAQAVASSQLDIAVDRIHHRVTMRAAASVYQGSDTLTSSAGTTTTDARIAPAAAPDPTGLVQAQPETLAQAQSTAQCVTGGGCSASTSGAPAFGHFLPILAVGVVAVVVVAAVGTIEYRRMARRREERRLRSGFAPSGLVNGAPAPSYAPPYAPIGPTEGPTAGSGQPPVPPRP